MQVLLRNLISGKFFTPDGGWSSHKAEARDFLSTVLAMEEVRKLELSGVEVMLVFNSESDPVGSS